jgi:hypothetical protein
MFFFIPAILIGSIKPTLYFYHVHTIRYTFEHSQKQESRLAIENKIGKPDSIENCGEGLWWDGDQRHPIKNNGECVTWTRYNLFLEAYAFGYSESNTLVSKYHYSSE